MTEATSVPEPIPAPEALQTAPVSRAANTGKSGKSRNALLDSWVTQFPVFATGKPLAVGIHKAILALQPDLDKAALRTAMRIHTQSTRYLKAITAGAARYNLVGEAEGSVTEEQAQQATEELKARMRKLNERRRAEQAAQRAEENAKHKAQREALAEAERQAKLQALVDKFKH